MRRSRLLGCRTCLLGSLRRWEARESVGDIGGIQKHSRERTESRSFREVGTISGDVGTFWRCQKLRSGLELAVKGKCSSLRRREYVALQVR
jgi:hypothetical protein